MSIQNEPTVDHAKLETERLRQDYVHFLHTYEALAVEAKKLPNPVTNDQEAVVSGSIIKQFKDLDNRVEGVRILEGEPHLRRKNAIDSFFFAIRDKIGKRNKNDRSAKPGVTDIIQARIDHYQTEKEERARAELERIRIEQARIAAEQARKAAEQTRIAEEQARIARELELKASRARADEQIRLKREAAEAQRKVEAQAAAEALAKQRAAEAALQEAEEARLATLARSADLTRTRGQDEHGAGVLLTTGKKPYAILEDADAISQEDFFKLKPYFTPQELEKAARSYAKATSYRKQLSGFAIGEGRKGITR